MRFELMTSSLPRRRSTPELRGPLFVCRAPRPDGPAAGKRETRLELATLSLEG